MVQKLRVRCCRTSQIRKGRKNRVLPLVPKFSYVSNFVTRRIIWTKEKGSWEMKGHILTLIYPPQMTHCNVSSVKLMVSGDPCFLFLGRKLFKYIRNLSTSSGLNLYLRRYWDKSVQVKINCRTWVVSQYHTTVLYNKTCKIPAAKGPTSSVRSLSSL